MAKYAFGNRYLCNNCKRVMSREQVLWDYEEDNIRQQQYSYSCCFCNEEMFTCEDEPKEALDCSWFEIDENGYLT